VSIGPLLKTAGTALNTFLLATAIPGIAESVEGLASRTLPSLGKKRVQRALDQAAKSSMRGSVDSFLGQQATQADDAFLDLLERRPGTPSFGANAGQRQVFDKALMDSLLTDNQEILRSITTRYQPPANNYLTRTMMELPPERIL